MIGLEKFLLFWSINVKYNNAYWIWILCILHIPDIWKTSFS